MLILLPLSIKTTIQSLESLLTDSMSDLTQSSSQSALPTFKQPSWLLKLQSEPTLILSAFGFLGSLSHPPLHLSDHMEDKYHKISILTQLALILADHFIKIHILYMVLIWSPWLEMMPSLLHHQLITTISSPLLLPLLSTPSLWFISQLESCQNKFAEIAARVLYLMAQAALIHALLELFHSITRQEQLDAKLAQLNLDLFFQEINVSLEQQLPQLSQPQE